MISRLLLFKVSHPVLFVVDLNRRKCCVWMCVLNDYRGWVALGGSYGSCCRKWKVLYTNGVVYISTQTLCLAECLFVDRISLIFVVCLVGNEKGWLKWNGLYKLVCVCVYTCFCVCILYLLWGLFRWLVVDGQAPETGAVPLRCSYQHYWGRRAKSTGYRSSCIRLQDRTTPNKTLYLIYLFMRVEPQTSWQCFTSIYNVVLYMWNKLNMCWSYGLQNIIEVSKVN